MVSSKSIYAATTGLLLAGLLPQGTQGHSWVETLRLIGTDGSFVGDVGYPIGAINRTTPGFSDIVAQNKILSTASNPAVCKPLAGAYDNFKRLGASAGDYVAMLYQENGHVTDPTQTKRPFRGGNVYVYGTLEHQDSDGINDVLNAWTADGKGGNGKGRLLASHYYDDGTCYQNRAATTTTTFPVYTERHAKYQADDISCQTDFQLPADLPASGKYTVMWVWDWPRIETDNTNVTEIYTSCAEIDLGAASSDSKVANAKNSIHFASPGANKIGSVAIPSQVQTLIEATALGVGTASPAPVALSESATAKPGDATDAPAQPTASTGVPVSVTTTTAHKSNGGKNNGIQTVTVTAEPETTTHYQTVTLGADGSAVGGNGGSQATTPSPSSAAAVPTSQAAGVPSVEPFISELQPSATQPAATTTATSNGPVVPTSAQAGAPSVSPFMKMVRATGAARRRQ